MTEKLKYKCVNCGQPTGALFKTYGPSVLKLTKCESCKGIVDKYIEYDPVIVMIDLVLISKEAQRHIIYNTDFKSYWKLFIILTMLETFGVWRNDSLFNIAVNSICDIRNNSTINSTHITLPFNYSIPEPWKSECWWWVHEEREEGDLFIWEKDFYIQFLSTFAGILTFIVAVHIMMTAVTVLSTQKKLTNVPAVRLLQSFALAHTSVMFALPTLVWGAPAAAATRLVHYALVFAYGFVVFCNVFAVLYEAPKPITVFVLALCHFLKYATMFHATPAIRRLII